MGEGHPIDPASMLATHFPRDLTDTVMSGESATVVLDIAGHGHWTVSIDSGVAESRGADGPRKPTCTIRTDADTLADVLIGRRSGVDAFLDGDLVTRGSLATVLQIGGAFAPDVELSTRPQSREVDAGGVRTAYLEAGRADAPPVVLLHGLGATNASMLPVLADLAEDHRVIAPDTPGSVRRKHRAGPTPPISFTPGFALSSMRSTPAAPSSSATLSVAGSHSSWPCTIRRRSPSWPCSVRHRRSADSGSWYHSSSCCLWMWRAYPRPPCRALL